MTTEKAKELIDKFMDVYPHRGMSKNAVRICIDEIIAELDKLHKPEYVTLITKYPDANYPEDGSGAETMDGYERKEFWQQVKEEIDK